MATLEEDLELDGEGSLGDGAAAAAAERAAASLSAALRPGDKVELFFVPLPRGLPRALTAARTAAAEAPSTSRSSGSASRGFSLPTSRRARRRRLQSEEVCQRGEERSFINHSTPALPSLSFSQCLSPSSSPLLGERCWRATGEGRERERDSYMYVCQQTTTTKNLESLVYILQLVCPLFAVPTTYSPESLPPLTTTTIARNKRKKGNKKQKRRGAIFLGDGDY